MRAEAGGANLGISLALVGPFLCALAMFYMAPQR